MMTKEDNENHQDTNQGSSACQYHLIDHLIWDQLILGLRGLE